jgi:elongation factor 2
MTEVSSQTAMTKSQNKHNRIHGTAGPLGNELSELIENGTVTPSQDIKARGKILTEDF